LKNYRKVLNRLKALKHPQSRKRERTELEKLVQEVVCRDQLPIPPEEDLALFDNRQTSDIDEDAALEAQPETPSSEVIDVVISPYGEELTGYPCCELVERSETMRVDRSAEIADMHGFHSTYHVSSKYRIRLIAEKTKPRVETLEHIHSGKSRTADLSAIGPDRSKAAGTLLRF
jgi:hypothetical protein